MQNNLVKIGYFDKKSPKSFVVSRKSTTFAPANRNKGVPKRSNFGVWCNGNTTDSGPVILGSSPSTPTEEIAKQLGIKLLAFFLFQTIRRIIGLCYSNNLVNYMRNT